MKELKKESQTYIENIFTTINSFNANTTKAETTDITSLYDEIGKQICLQSEKAFVAHLCEHLKNEFPNNKGFSTRNLRRMREFYLRYENSPKIKNIALALNWTQNSVILEMCSTTQEAEFYLNLTTNRNLSKLALISAIESKEYEQEQEQNSNEHCESTNAPVCDFIDTTTVDTPNQDENHCSKDCEGIRQEISLPKAIPKNKDKLYDWTVWVSTMKEKAVNKEISVKPSEVMVAELLAISNQHE